MDRVYLPFDTNPSVPAYSAPPGAVDAHCHVFGPGERFPFAPARKYTPVDAPKEKLFALREHLGLSRNVIVQASCHGTDNAALVDALNAAGDRARGVAVVSEDVADKELVALHRAGVRAVRFNFVKRLVDVAPETVLLGIARRVAKLGWHIVVYLEAADLAGRIPFLEKLPTIVVIDHMGRPDISKGAGHKDFKSFVSLLAENKNFWTKVSCPERLSLQGPGTGETPDYADVVPFARTLVERFPDRVLWGTDWPHPNMRSHMPDDGALVDFIPLIAQDETTQKALLVDNPMRLYWAEHPEKQGAN
ncbi:MAG TPA: 2-pyrone-4,6-dicarboxylate hydrolase [Devosia sp.]|nr:2-pyrone-4,6-dicarboxylate hydrolase [Devosia sp.]